jgi:hypothetical protein
MKKILIVITVLIVISCSPKVNTTLIKSYPALDYKEEVEVLGISDTVPASAIVIGKVKIGDSGFSTDCGWNTVIEKAKLEARKAGGNVIKIIQHIPPKAMGSSCDRIIVNILRVDNPEEIKLIKTRNISKIDSTWKYAKLYVYRKPGYGSLIGYDLYLGDSLIYRVKNRSKQEFKITKKGLNKLWARTETTSEVPVDFEYGKEYYLKCSVVMGVMMGRPKIEFVEKLQGNSEYSSFKSR